MNELLFDGLLALEVIRDFEVLKADAEEWARLDEEEKKQKEEHYSQKQRVAKSCISLSNIVIELMAKVTTNV